MTGKLKVAVAVASGGLVPLYEHYRNGVAPLKLAQLRAVYPRLSEAEARKYLRPLNAAAREAGISTPRRLAAFLAQLGHESSELRRWQEGASGEAYEGRADLGNTQPGDGRRYKGRGPIQLTGRANYRAAGKALGVDLEGKPELALETDTGFRVAAWYWRTRGLNELADAGTPEAFREITRRINGGQNGAADRERYWRTAKAVLEGGA